MSKSCDHAQPLDSFCYWCETADELWDPEEWGTPKGPISSAWQQVASFIDRIVDLLRQAHDPQ